MELTLIVRNKTEIQTFVEQKSLYTFRGFYPAESEFPGNR